LTSPKLDLSARGSVRTAGPAKDGAFVTHVGEVEVRYWLPPAIDPKAGDSFPGNYHFNPFTGTKLAPAPAEQPHTTGLSGRPAAASEAPAKP
jgi:hypothetical protein